MAGLNAQDILAPEQVADVLQVRRSTVMSLARSGAIPSFKIGKHVRFARDDVAAYLQRLRHEPGAGKESE